MVFSTLILLGISTVVGAPLAFANDPNPVASPAPAASPAPQAQFPADAPLRTEKTEKQFGRVVGQELEQGKQNEYPVPGEPNGNADDVAPDTTPFLLVPAPEYLFRGGYSATGDTAGVGHGGGIGVLLLLEAGKSQIYIDANYQQNKEGGAIDAEAKVRLFTSPIDKKPLDTVNRQSVFWYAANIDIAGRGSWNPRAAGFFKTQAGAYLGTMRHFSNGNCIVEFFTKAAVSIYDTRTQTTPQYGHGWDTFARPAVGAEGMLHCEKLRIFANYEHVFAFSGQSNIDAAALQSSYVWNVPMPNGTTLGVGLFAKGQVENWQGRPDLVGTGDPRVNDRLMMGVFTGIEFRPMFRKPPESFNSRE